MNTNTNEANANDIARNKQRNFEELRTDVAKRMVSVFKTFVIKNIIKFYIKIYMKFELSVYFSLHNTLEY